MEYENKTVAINGRRLSYLLSSIGLEPHDFLIMASWGNEINPAVAVNVRGMNVSNPGLVVSKPLALSRERPRPLENGL